MFNMFNLQQMGFLFASQFNNYLKATVLEAKCFLKCLLHQQKQVFLNPFYFHRVLPELGF